MRAVIKGGPLRGVVAAPVSKSDLHRILICSAFSKGKTVITSNGPLPDDVTATVSCLEALGASISVRDGSIEVVPAVSIPATATLFVGESGSTLRFLVPVAAALGVDACFVMGGRLPERPMDPLISSLEERGVSFSRPDRTTLRVCGKLTGKRFSVRPDVSSQFISGILFALPLIGGGTVSFPGKAESAGYIDMTCGTMARFGAVISRENETITVGPAPLVSPGTVAAEGDWSAASFWLCAGALSDEGIKVTGIEPASLQGDSAIVSILQNMGARVTISNGECTVRRGELRGVSVDAADVPDLVPPVASLAALADGETVIYGASRLRLKESDRLAALSAALSALGADIEAKNDGLKIRGKETLPGGSADSAGDHRIAMAAAIASLRACDVTVNGAEAVAKSYPGFWDDFRGLGGCVKTEE